MRLLTNPKTVGYVQNPISVYYCYQPDRTLQKCIAEVRATGLQVCATAALRRPPGLG